MFPTRPRVSFFLFFFFFFFSLLLLLLRSSTNNSVSREISSQYILRNSLESHTNCVLMHQEGALVCTKRVLSLGERLKIKCSSREEEEEERIGYRPPYLSLDVSLSLSVSCTNRILQRAKKREREKKKMKKIFFSVRFQL